MTVAIWHIVSSPDKKRVGKKGKNGQMLQMKIPHKDTCKFILTTILCICILFEHIQYKLCMSVSYVKQCIQIEICNRVDWHKHSL